MWAAIVALGLSVFGVGPTSVKCDCEKNMKGMRERMSQGVRQWQGARGASERDGSRRAPEHGQRGEEKKGERKKPKKEKKK